MRPEVRLLWLGLAAALSACALGDAGRRGAPRSVLLAEDLREADSAPLRRAAASLGPRTRRRALLAMGRIQGEACLEPLLGGLGDPDAGVRAQAVFSLGQLGLAEPALSTATLARAAAAVASAREPVLARARVEALGKLSGPEFEGELLAALSGGGPEVRGEAALALFRQRFLGRAPEYSTAAVSALAAAFHDADAGVRWRAVYAFSRFAEPRAASGLAEAAADAAPSVRFFACRALGKLGEAAQWQPLAKDAVDPDPLVRAEAVRALGLAKKPEYVPEAALRDEVPAVRAAAADALADGGDRKLAYWLDELAEDGSALVKGEALLAWPKLRPQTALSALEARRADLNWWVRSRAYEALSGVPGSEAALRNGLLEPDQRVASAALEALAKSTGTEIDSVLSGVIRSSTSSLELLGAAVDAVAQRKDARFAGDLRLAARGALVRQYPELADGIREAYGKLPGDQPGLGLPPAPKPLPSPFLGRPAPPGARVVFETSRGDFELVLASTEAPVHAASFLDDVRRRVYDGLIWHRVSPGFVVQGGDPRGSGWGDCGFALRDEINEIPFDAGVVGMPKAGKDTGGCQLFITLVPTPHLDGRYTAFGRVVSGLDVVERLEPGDQIKRAYLKR